MKTILATLKSRERFGCSQKETHHLVLDISGTGVTYDVGDCVAIFPTNRPEHVKEIFPDFTVDNVTDRDGNTHTLRHFLAHHANLNRYKPGMPAEKLPPLLPRYYSIASSMQVVGEEIHLIVRQIDCGVCAHYLCESVQLGDQIPLYIHEASTFKLPDNNIPIIMIGPGTGVAPYRGFMQERIARGAPSQNWLFFGEWTRKNHYFYQDYWYELEKQGRLRLNLAFSRDQDEKIYVQHRMWEQRKDLWKWLQEGATLYVCGDAKEMAKAVDKTLREIAIHEGNLSQEAAKDFYRALRKSHRYLRDIY